MNLWVFGLSLFACLIGVTWAVEDKPCRVWSSEMTKRQLKGTTHCIKSMKFKNGKDKAAKSSCIMKCAMINEGFLGSDGKMTEKHFHEFVENNIPNNIKVRFLPMMDSCREKHGDLIDPSEEFCRSYEPLIKCLTLAMFQLCQEPKTEK